MTALTNHSEQMRIKNNSEEPLHRKRLTGGERRQRGGKGGTTPSRYTHTPNPPVESKSDATCLCGARAALGCHDSAKAKQRREVSPSCRRRVGCSCEPIRRSSSQLRGGTESLWDWLALSLVSLQISLRGGAEAT